MIHGKHTIYLKTLMEDPNVRPLLNKALSTYPMYEPQNPDNYSIIPTREQLNTKLLNHYKYREIGSETVGRFLDDLETTMCEIMPYYYQLFKSEDIMNGIEDPFGNVDIEEKFEEETTGNSSGSTTGKSNNTTETTAESNTSTDMTTAGKNVNSKTPQSQLEVTAQNIDTLDYADNVTWNKEESNSTGETSDRGSANSNTTSEGTTENETSGTTKHTFTKKGNQGVNTYAHDMKELREIFRNIEEEIIHNPKIAELFFLVFE